MTKKKTDVGAARTFEPGLLAAAGQPLPMPSFRSATRAPNSSKRGCTQRTPKRCPRSPKMRRHRPGPARQLAAAQCSQGARHRDPRTSAYRQTRGGRERRRRVGGGCHPPDPTGGGVIFIAARTASSKLQLVQVSFRKGVGLQESGTSRPAARGCAKCRRHCQPRGLRASGSLGRLGPFAGRGRPRR